MAWHRAERSLRWSDPGVMVDEIVELATADRHYRPGTYNDPVSMW
ncbi:MAG: hypothetical protein ACYCTZ_12275 [Candidatus Dormibacteria bacterium]